MAGPPAAPVVILGTVAVFTVHALVDAGIESQADLDHLRIAILANTLHHRMLEDPLPFDTDRRYALSVLNMVYYNLYFMFLHHYERATNEEQAWIFEEDSDACYLGIGTEVCTRNRVAWSPMREKTGLPSTSKLPSMAPTLPVQKETQWRALIVPRTAEPYLTSPSVSPGVGDSATSFLFSVTYSHGANVDADSVTLSVDGADYPLALASGTPLAGIDRSHCAIGI